MGGPTRSSEPYHPESPRAAREEELSYPLDGVLTREEADKLLCRLAELGYTGTLRSVGDASHLYVLEIEEA